MNEDDAINAALREAGIEDAVTATRDLSGGCIHRVRELTLAGGTRLVAKINDAPHVGMFREEAVGLEALADTRTVLVPRPLAVTDARGAAVLLMTAIVHGRAGSQAWGRFGRELAALHGADPGDVTGYGFNGDNHLGTTPQPNRWHDDWIRFNADCRLGHQLTLAARNNLLSGSEARRVERVIDRLETLIPRRPKPALLHGDLWSGNALGAVEESGEQRIAVIDPACSYGDGWADIAMMRLFGGFPSRCLEAYAAETDDREGVEPRITVYQLYHLLNHVNLFGRGYAGQAMTLAASLGA
ncbi:MAG: fructosamine kinase family protein [Planctomycetota bacterium]|jgi:fructosamine-3-kinase